MLVVRLWQGPRPITGRQVEVTITAGAGVVSWWGLTPTSGPLSLITDANGNARFYLSPDRLPPGPEDGVVSVRASSGSLVANATFAVQREPEPPVLVSAAVVGGVPSPLREGTTLNLNVNLTKGGQPYLPAQDVVVSLSSTLGTFLPNAGSTPLQSIALTIGPSGQATVGWRAPTFGIGMVQAVLRAAIAGSQPDVSQPWETMLSVEGSRVSPTLGDMMPGVLPPVRALPASQSPPTLFTSVRARSGHFQGNNKPAVTTHDGFTGTMSSEEWVKDAEKVPGTPLGPHDHFDGDLDDDPNDPGDPRDENARTEPYKKEAEEDRTVPAEEGDDGARKIIRVIGTGWNPDLEGTSGGPESQVSASYTASNLLHGVKPTHESSGSASFSQGQLTGLINSVPWGHGNDDGWMGNGDHGLMKAAVSSRHTSEQKKETVSWLDSSKTPKSAELNWTEHNASKTVAQVRLQSSKAVENEEGMSATFILMRSEYTLPKQGEEPAAPVVTFLGTITLKIPKGQKISKFATPTGQAGQHLKTEDGNQVIDLKADNFQEGKEIVLDAMPVDIEEVFERDQKWNKAPSPKHYNGNYGYNDDQREGSTILKRTLFVAVEPGSGKVELDVKGAGGSSGTMQTLVGLKSHSGTMLNDVATMSGGVAHLDFTPAHGINEGKHELCIGLDKNSNGKLDTDEVFVFPQDKKFWIRTVTTSDYSSNRSSIAWKQDVAYWSVGKFTSDVLETFLGDTATLGESTSTTTATVPINRSDLTHIAGSTYNPTNGETTIDKFHLPDGSDATLSIEKTLDIEASVGLRGVLDQTWNHYRSQFQTQLMSNPSLQTWTSGPVEITPTNGSINCSQGGPEIPQNLSYSIGTAGISGTMNFTIQRNPQDSTKFYLKQLDVDCTVEDLIDYDWTRGPNSESRIASIVQIGWQPTSRKAGKIFFVSIRVVQTYGAGALEKFNVAPGSSTTPPGGGPS